MANVVKIEDVQKLILDVRGQKILVDADVAVLYGVGTGLLPLNYDV